jgi:hypothetical protein
MAVYRAGGALMFPQEPLGWNYGRMVEKVGRLLRSFCPLFITLCIFGLRLVFPLSFSFLDFLTRFSS